MNRACTGGGLVTCDLSPACTSKVSFAAGGNGGNTATSSIPSASGVSCKRGLPAVSTSVSSCTRTVAGSTPLLLASAAAVVPECSACSHCAGVTPIALADADDLPQQVLDATGGEGVHAVIDPLGGGFTGAAIRSSAPDAIHVLAGNQAGAVAPIVVPMMLLREHTIIGLNGFRISEDEQHRLMQASLADQVSGVLTADIGAVFPLAEAPQAYQSAASGRVVLSM